MWVSEQPMYKYLPLRDQLALAAGGKLRKGRKKEENKEQRCSVGEETVGGKRRTQVARPRAC